MNVSTAAHVFWLGCSVWLGAGDTLGAASQEAPSAAPSGRIRAPVTLQLLERRAQYQRQLAQGAAVFHGFRFEDRVEASGIRFEHRPVEDAGKAYKPVQYDHGNGVAAADVDRDGRVDLYFTSQLGSNELWRNLGEGRFTNITARAGVGMPDQISVAAAFGDVDNDGAPDLFVTTVRHGNRLYRNLGDGRFEDISRVAGVDYSGHSSGAVFFDYDADGLLDLFVANVGRYTTDRIGPGGYHVGMTNAFDGHLYPERSEPSLLYHNEGQGRFREVSKELGLRVGSTWSGEATAADLDGDGDPDLYLTNMQGDDRYFENQGGRGFLEKTPATFPKTPWGAVGVKAFDADQDGRLDLFVTDMHSDMTPPQINEANSFRPDLEKRKSEAWCSIQWTDAYLQGGTNNLFGNALYLANPATPVGFREASETWGAETYWPWGPSVGDLNNDGFPDVFVSSGMGYPFRYAMNAILLNDAGRRFLDAEFLLGIEPRAGGWLGKAWFELDCSGTDAAHPGCAGKSGRISVPGSLSTRGSVLLDLDDDGDLDLVTLEFGDRPQVLVSDLAQRRPAHFLSVQLVGRRSNRDGLGAKVRVTSGGRVGTQWHDGKSGYLGHSLLPLHFGLGDATKVDAVEIQWPSGKRQVLRDVAANRRLQVVEE